MPPLPARLQIVLVEPEIPHNTGAIGRSCLATGARLHLVHPLGFQLGAEQLRRSGLDYWQHVAPVMHDSLEAFLAQLPTDAQLCLFTTRATASLYETRIAPDSWLLFGPESRGLPDWLLERYPDKLLRIPMLDGPVRSLNLANAVSIAAYEAWRQQA
ncbi:MAG: tRNA (cytidine(34)-2'-O)-methyltransferase [bacterium]